MGPAFSISRQLFHGTRAAVTSRFDLQAGPESHPFGPAVYLTADVQAAIARAGEDGAVLLVEVGGAPAQTINLDKPISHQSRQGQTAISVLLAFVGQTEFNDELNARAAIDMAAQSLGKRKRNEFLASMGVWMLHGHLDGSEVSGPADRGVQYAVLKTEAILGFRPHAGGPVASKG
jgi:hypothetical protein